VIEIGALRGETTVKMLHDLGPECELHVIDPLPQFDPTEHERAFPGRYFFHLGISHDILPTLAPADVVLVDGDHNWYTVYNELKMLAATARTAEVPLPLIVLHDVGWPYGRRDLYYEPSRIPDEFRQPYRRKGIRPGRSGHAPLGGMNVELDNADHEGGPRNGVFTAVEDFVAEHDQPVRLAMFPLYFGLAVIAEIDLIEQHPELGFRLDEFESREGQARLVALGERVRIDEAIVSQTWLRSLNERIERATTRYLEIVKSALLDEHYLDNEVRLEFVVNALERGEKNLDALRDPPRQLRAQYQRLARARADGRAVGDTSWAPYTDMGRAQLDHLERALSRVVANGVAGDFADIGVGRGGAAIFIRAWVAATEMRDRNVWLIDEFQPSRGDLHQVRDGFDRFGLLDETVRFAQGPPDQMLVRGDVGQLALVRFGGEELGDALAPALDSIAAHLSEGSVVVVSGTSNDAVAQVVHGFRERSGFDAPLERIHANAVSWTTGARPPATTIARRDSRSVALSPPLPPGTVALSIVIVLYNMRREGRRTLHSLSRAYQRGIEDLPYEVIVVDNGSDDGDRLSVDEIVSYGPEFHLLDMGADAHPSPVGALNAGLSVSRGENVALMIDGAHLLTPGVLHNAMIALTAYAPAVVAVQQWYVGPGQQPDTSREGYDQTIEDRLFERIEWPSDGYRLFEISHFIGERDWFDGIVESNCIVAPRKLLEQIGAFDDRFSMPGAGYANLDLFERLALTPGVNVVSMLGEGTFHQFHGGTTTNVVDQVEHRARVAAYGEHFKALRGRGLLGLDRPVKFVGALDPPAAKRTRARRAFESLGPLRDPVKFGAHTAPVAVPEELKLAAIEAAWDQQSWRDTTWLGHRVNRYPADLQCYQELVARNGPETVVVTGDDDGLAGRALFFASLFDLVGHGVVVAVGDADVAAFPAHPRVTYVQGRADDEPVARQVREIASQHGGAMVFLALGAHSRVISAFEHYQSLVPVGGYVVVENTVVNGRPAAAGFGAGPLEGVFHILAAHPDFVSDRTFERYMVTFNRDGYLRRMEPK
jgi:cephalosporin hydroxylase